MFIINQTPIGKNYKPYIIAELSANHGGSLNKAKRLLDPQNLLVLMQSKYNLILQTP